MSGLDRFLAALLWCLAVLCVAGLVHILAVFNLPKFERNGAFGRIAALTKASGLTLLPRVAPGAEWAPFSDPALAQGACRFDLTHNPMRLRGEIDGDRMLTLSFRTPAGDIFYSMTDRAAQRGTIDVLLLTADQLETLEAETDEDEPAPQELRLVAPTTKGFVLVNALAAFPSGRIEAEQRVKAISCEPETVAQ
ncbi:DUF1254 domain-containing protein [Methylocella sp.]|jgi:uncharacterized membrane protein|uniref:DUF1254 domain-containing protein n=1 Tax=Methylocella sp. TaxID=1978226 RepID=UPI003C202534